MQAARPTLMPNASSPTDAQRRWLGYGLKQPGGKLPLYDEVGARVAQDLITSCVKAGWAEPWALNPLRPEPQICRLTEAGRQALNREAVIRVDFSMWRRDTTDSRPATLPEVATRR
jgi:hypothetical protein